MLGFPAAVARPSKVLSSLEFCVALKAAWECAGAVAEHAALRKAERRARKADFRAALEAERARIAERIMMAAQNGRQPLTAEAVLAAAGVQVIAADPPTWR